MTARRKRKRERRPMPSGMRFVGLRVPVAEYERWLTAARWEERTLSDWIRRHLRSDADFEFSIHKEQERQKRGEKPRKAI